MTTSSPSMSSGTRRTRLPRSTKVFSRSRRAICSRSIAARADSRRTGSLRPGKRFGTRTRLNTPSTTASCSSRVVRGRLRSSSPIGVLLSGGIDSSSVVGAAQQLYRAGRATDRGFTTFTLTFDGLACDERDLARDVEEMYGLDARYVAMPRAGDRLQLSPPAFKSRRTPVPPRARDRLFREVTAAGVRVLLTGDLADACTGGSSLFFDSLLRHGDFAAYWRHVRLYRALGQPLRRVLFVHSLMPLLPAQLHRRLDQLRVRRQFTAHRAGLLPPWLVGPLRRSLEERYLALLIQETEARRYANPAREGEFRMLYPPEIARHPAPWPVWSSGARSRTVACMNSFSRSRQSKVPSGQRHRLVVRRIEIPRSRSNAWSHS